MSAPTQFLMKRGATSQSVIVRFLNQISMVPQTSLTAAQAGLVIQYYQMGAGLAPVSVAPTSVATISSSWASGAFQTLWDGFVRVDLPDAAWADLVNVSGFGKVNQVLVTVQGTNLFCPGAMVQLVDGDKITTSTPNRY